VVEQRRLERFLRYVQRVVIELDSALAEAGAIVRSTRSPRGSRTTASQTTSSSVRAERTSSARRNTYVPWSGMPSDGDPTLSSPQVVTSPPPHAARQSVLRVPASPAAAIHASGTPRYQAAPRSSPRSWMEPNVDAAVDPYVDGGLLRNQGDLVRVSDSLTWDRRETYLEASVKFTCGHDLRYRSEQGHRRRAVRGLSRNEQRRKRDRPRYPRSPPVAAMCPSGIRRW